MENNIPLASALLASPRVSLSEERPEMLRTQSFDKKFDHDKLSQANESGSEEAPEYDVLILTNDGFPFPMQEEEVDEPTQCTIRGILVGSFLGTIVGASNIYLGLKTGFTFGGSLFGSMLGYAIIKFVVIKALPTRWNGGAFGPKENCAIQTTASSVGGLTGIFVNAVPAMYRLNLLSDNVTADFGRHLLLVAVTSFYGIAFAIPLRKLYIIHQRLTFPSSFAVAVVLRSLHTDTSGKAAKKTKILIIAMAAAFVFVVVGSYIPGILLQFHFFWHIGTPVALQAESWGWFWEWSPAFLGSGALVGLNSAFSLLAGSILAWAILGPILVSSGLAVGRPHPGAEMLTNYFGMKIQDGQVSPRYWMLWPGVVMMFCTSMTEVAMCAPTFYRSGKVFYRDLSNRLRERRGLAALPLDEKDTPVGLLDNTPEEEQVPLWTWSSLLAVVSVATVIVLKFSFDIHPGLTILALVMGFLFAFVGCNAAGTSDINPIGSIAKASQLVVGGITGAQKLAVREAQLANISLAAVTSQAASNSVDMIGDLKTGFLLGASPKGQFWAQTIGAVVGMPVAVALFTLFAKAYPCLVTKDATCTDFAMPAVTAWQAVTEVLTSGGNTIPKSCLIFCGVSGFVSIAVVLIKHFLVPQQYRVWVVNMNSIGLGFVLYQIHYSLMMVLGAILGFFWAKWRPKQFDLWVYPLAAGLIAGEGMGGMFIAILTIAGIGGSVYGIKVGCPAIGC